MFKFLDKLFKSSNFAIILMITISIISIYGTLFPAKTPFDFNLYKTPFFIFLLFIFAINIAYCSYFRVVKTFIAINKGNFGGQPILYVKEEIIEELKEYGYKVKKIDKGYLISKGALRTYSIIGLHVFIVALLIVAGLSSYLGFLGTVNVYEKKSTDICFSWKEKKDVYLPFTISINSANIDFYPMPLKLLVEDRVTGDNLEIVTSEGGTFSFKDYKIKIFKAIIEKKTIIFYLMKDGMQIGPFENQYMDNERYLNIKFLAYQEPLPKQYYADITVGNNEKNIRKQISINNPLNFEGYNIYLIDIGSDQFGFPYVGLQITYEPFINFIWLLSFFIILSLFIYPFVSQSFISLKAQENRYAVYVWKTKFTNRELEILKKYEIS